MLNILAETHVRLIVNELRDAPYLYVDKAAREAGASFMRDRVAREVERRGFTYVRLDSDLEDDDYFDYNHLNSKGIAKYSPLIADVIARQMQT